MVSLFVVSLSWSVDLAHAFVQAILTMTNKSAVNQIFTHRHYNFASLFKLCLIVLLKKENDLKRLNAPKCEDPGPWTYTSKSLKTYQQKLEFNVNCFYFSASNGHRYQTGEAKALKYTVKHFAHHFSPLSSSLITSIVISLWLVVFGAHELEKL